MKFKYILIVLSVLQFGACSDDKGNYIYKEINELMVVENLVSYIQKSLLSIAFHLIL